MDCKEVGSVLFLFFDNEMEDDLLTPFRDHVARCGECARQMDYTRKLLLVVRERWGWESAGFAGISAGGRGC